jgi:hypothetical protein
MDTTTAGLILAGLLGVVSAFVWGFKLLLKSVVDNMKASTAAIENNTKVMARVSATLDRAVAVDAERDMFIKASLERIERAVS